MRKKLPCVFTAVIPVAMMFAFNLTAIAPAQSGPDVDPVCQSACVQELFNCIASGQNQHRCIGQYHHCRGQCK